MGRGTPRYVDAMLVVTSYRGRVPSVANSAIDWLTRRWRHGALHDKPLAVVGRSAIKKPTFNFHGVTEAPDAFRRTAVAFEDLAVAAYKYQAPRLRSLSYLQTAIAVHSVEARHAAWIRRLAGVLPAATAFDQPLPPSQVDGLVASTHFVVASPRTSARGGSPRFTG